MEKQMSDRIINDYEPHSGIRTFLGVVSSLTIMGLPVGATELFRPGGDLKVAFWGGVATVIGLVTGYLSFRGTLKE